MILEGTGVNAQVQSESDATAFSFDQRNATLEMYYTNAVIKSSTAEELDTIKKTMVFPLSGVRATKIEHNHQCKF